MGFSNQNREETRLKVKDETFDLLIIGGGLTGASIALDAATRGMSTVLLEMSDFATKGSARHVMLTTEQENYHYKAWKRLEEEKAMIKTNFSPLYQEMTGVHVKYRGDQDLKDMTTIKRGLLYPFKRNHVDQSLQVLGKNQVLKLAPAVNSKKLERGLRFKSGLINRSLMTIELLKKAKQFGASPLNYFKVTEFIYDEHEQIIGVKAEDQINGQMVSFYAHQILNTTGKDLDQIRKLDKADMKEEYVPSVNRVTQFQVKSDKKLIKNVVSVNNRKNNGFITLTPYNNRLIITVTESINQPANFNQKWSSDEIKHYLAVTQQVIQSEVLSHANVIDINRAYTVKYQHKSVPSSLVAISESGLISALGTSTVSFRLYASKIVDIIAKGFKKELNILYSNSETRDISVNKTNQIEQASLLDPFDQIEITDQQLKQLIKHYGDETPDLLNYYQKAKQYSERYRIDRLLCTEILYSVEEAAIYTPLDFFIRRSRLNYDIIMIQEQLTGILTLLSSQLPWTKEERSYFEREMKIWMNDQLD